MKLIKQKTKRIILELDESLIQRLDSLRQEQKVTRKKLIEFILLDFLNNLKKGK